MRGGMTIFRTMAHAGQVRPWLRPLVLVGLVVVVLVFWSEGRYLTGEFGQVCALDLSVLGISALGMMVVIAVGGVDMSVAALALLSATVAGWVMQHGVHSVVAAGTGILVGLCFGLLNGIFSEFLRAPLVVVTLCAMVFLEAMSRLASGGMAVSTTPLRWVMDGSWFGWDWPFLPFGVWMFLGLAGVVSVVMRRTSVGPILLEVGADERAAKVRQVNTQLVKILACCVCGGLASLAGLLETARLTIAQLPAGPLPALEVVAAVLIGGGALSGGRASVAGTLISAALIVVVRKGMALAGLAAGLYSVALANIILSALLIERLRRSSTNIVETGREAQNRTTPSAPPPEIPSFLRRSGRSMAAGTVPILLALLGCLCLLAATRFGQAIFGFPDPIAEGRVVFVIPSILFTCLAAVAGREMIRENQELEDAQALDNTRPYALLLRPFTTDTALPVANPEGSSWLFSPRAAFEDRRIDLARLLAQAVKPQLQLRAIGGTPTGPGIIRSPDDQWRGEFQQLAQGAHGIILIPVTGKEIPWELEQLRQHGWLQKTVLLIPGWHGRGPRPQAVSAPFLESLRANGFEIPHPQEQTAMVRLDEAGRSASTVVLKNLKYRTIRAALWRLWGVL